MTEFDRCLLGWRQGRSADRESPARVTERDARQNAGVGNFARNVERFSHEFRTPLTVVREHLFLLGDDLGDRNQRQTVERIADRIDDLNRIINDFLDSLKLEAGTLDVNRCEWRLADFVAEIRPFLERKAATANCTLSFDVLAELPPVYCDKDQVGRAILTITRYAINHCFPGAASRLSARENKRPAEVCLVVEANSSNADGVPWGSAPDCDSGRIQADQRFAPKLKFLREILSRNLTTFEVESATPDFYARFGLPTTDPAEIVSRYQTSCPEVSPSNACVDRQGQVRRYGRFQSPSGDAGLSQHLTWAW